MSYIIANQLMMIISHTSLSTLVLVGPVSYEVRLVLKVANFL